MSGFQSCSHKQRSIAAMLRASVGMQPFWIWLCFFSYRQTVNVQGTGVFHRALAQAIGAFAEPTLCRSLSHGRRCVAVANQHSLVQYQHDVVLVGYNQVALKNVNCTTSRIKLVHLLKSGSSPQPLNVCQPIDGTHIKLVKCRICQTGPPAPRPRSVSRRGNLQH